MRQVHRAGEKVFIDYCGPTVPVVDRSTGEMRKAQVFVAGVNVKSGVWASGRVPV
jgi:transposase